MASFWCLEPQGRFKVEWTMGQLRFPSSMSGYCGPGSEQPSPTGRDEDSESRAKCIWNPLISPFFPFVGFPKIQGSPQVSGQRPQVAVFSKRCHHHRGAPSLRSSTPSKSTSSASPAPTAFPCFSSLHSTHRRTRTRGWWSTRTTSGSG